MKPMYIYANISLTSSLKRNISDKSCRENQNTHFMFSNFFPKIVLFMKLLKKYCTAGQTTDDNII